MLAAQVRVTEWATTVGERFTVVVLLIPFNPAVMVAVWLVLIVPAVATKVALLVPLIVTLAGTLSVPTLLDRLTVVALVATLVNVTVQVEVCPLPSAAGEQLTPDSCAGAVKFSDAVGDAPLALAVSTAV